MKPTQTIFFTAVLLLYAADSFSQTLFPMDAKGFVAYKQVFQLSPKVKADDVYAIAQKWLEETPAKFTQKNVEVPIDAEKAKKNKNKIEVDKNFENSVPLKSLDPAGRKLTGRGVLQYYNGNTNSIRLLYLDYDVYIKIEGNVLTASLANYKYFHFNPKTYGKVNLFSFEGGPACDAMGHLEELIKCQHSNDEFKSLATYSSKESAKLLATLKATLAANKVLAIGSSTVTASKSTVKKSTAPAAAKQPIKK